MKSKMGICEWCLPFAGPGSIKLAADMGFDGVQIGDLGGSACNFPMNEQWVQEAYMQTAIEKDAELQTLHLRTLAQQGTMLYPRDTPQGQQAALSIRKGVEACSAMKIPTLFLSSFFATLIRNDYEFENYAAHLRYACDYGREKGIKIVYESVLPIDRFLKMRELAGEDLGILYDVVNPFVYGSGVPSDELRAFGKDAIDQIHVKDRGPDYKGFTLLGEGACRVEESADVLRQLNWSGWVVSETNFFELPFVEGRSTFALIKSDLCTMRRLFG